MCGCSQPIKRGEKMKMNVGMRMRDEKEDTRRLLVSQEKDGRKRSHWKFLFCQDSAQTIPLSPSSASPPPSSHGNCWRCAWAEILAFQLHGRWKLARVKVHVDAQLVKFICRIKQWVREKESDYVSVCLACTRSQITFSSLKRLPFQFQTFVHKPQIDSQLNTLMINRRSHRVQHRGRVYFGLMNCKIWPKQKKICEM